MLHKYRPRLRPFRSTPRAGRIARHQTPHARRLHIRRQPRIHQPRHNQLRRQHTQHQQPRQRAPTAQRAAAQHIQQRHQQQQRPHIHHNRARSNHPDYLQQKHRQRQRNQPRQPPPAPQVAQRQYAPHHVVPQMIALPHLAEHKILLRRAHHPRQPGRVADKLKHAHQALQHRPAKQRPGKNFHHPVLPQPGYLKPASPSQQRHHAKHRRRQIRHFRIRQPQNPRLHQPKSRQQHKKHHRPRQPRARRIAPQREQCKQSGKQQRAALNKPAPLRPRAPRRQKRHHRHQRHAQPHHPAFFQPFPHHARSRLPERRKPSADTKNNTAEAKAAAAQTRLAGCASNNRTTASAA